MARIGSWPYKIHCQIGDMARIGKVMYQLGDMARRYTGLDRRHGKARFMAKYDTWSNKRHSQDR